MKLLASILERKGWTTRVELRIQTSRGLRKPDLLAYKPGEAAWILDVSIVSDQLDDLDKAVMGKIEKYRSVPEIAATVEGELGLVPAFTGFVLSWRGDYALASAKDARLLGLNRGELTFLSAVCTEQSAVVHRVHQTSLVMANSGWELDGA